MPKRVIDGEGVWRSDRLAQVEPPRFRAEYANLLPLALANGVFEVAARRVWITVYSYNRPDVSLEHVELMLAEFERVKLLFRWTEPVTGKQWGYFVGIEKPGRLPSRSRVAQGHWEIGPELPRAEYEQFLGASKEQKLVATPGITNGKPLVNQRVDDGYTGVGLGSGLGIGEKGQPSVNQEPESTINFNATEVAQILCLKNGWSGQKMISALRNSIDYQSKKMPESSMDEVGEWLVASYFDHQRKNGKFAVSPLKYFEQALYRTASNGPTLSAADLLADNPATRALAQLEAD